ncbi:MAG: hypothetical protein ACI35O_13495 [Bacillaceae bacterium]
MAVSIAFDKIIVNNLSNNASIATGDNNLSAWQSYGKHNYGNGVPIGTNYLIRNITIVNDNDYIDLPIDNTTVNNPQPNIQI